MIKLCSLGLVRGVGLHLFLGYNAIILFSLLSQCFIPHFVGICLSYIVIQVVSWPSTLRVRTFFHDTCPIRVLLEVGCELWWHCSRVISLLMQSAKWVLSNIECRGSGCFICTLPSLAWWQIFLLFLSTCPMVFRIGL